MKCVEVSDDANRHDGLCECKDSFELNPASTSTETYCIEDNGIDPKSIKSIANNIPTAMNDNFNDTITASQSTAGSEEIQEKLHKKSNTNHVIAGILIPIAFVFAVIGSVFIYKKLHITQRIRNMHRTRRSRPFYEDVMLGSNDTDDPPLI